jgi:hypothetical protein
VASITEKTMLRFCGSIFMGPLLVQVMGRTFYERRKKPCVYALM